MNDPSNFLAGSNGPEFDHRCGSPMRRRAAELIWHARRHGAGQAVAMRDAWRERLAICTCNGGLREEQAEQIALDELEKMLHHKGSFCYDPDHAANL